MDWKNILVPLDIDKLSKKEKIMHIFVFAIIPIIFIISVILILRFDLGEAMLLLPFIFLYLGLVSPVVFHKFIVKRVEYHSEYRLGPTYQYDAVATLFFLPAIISGGLVIGYIFDNIFLGVGITVAFVIPIVGHFLRRNIFNDDSRDLDGNDVLGYYPHRTGLISVIIGCYGYICGFRGSIGYNALI